MRFGRRHFGLKGRASSIVDLTRKLRCHFLATPASSLESYAAVPRAPEVRFWPSRRHQALLRPAQDRGIVQ
jgi:hypothetical protein